MRIKLFGNLRITCAGRPVTSVNTNRLHSLTAYLILHRDTPHPRERLAFALWPGFLAVERKLLRLLGGTAASASTERF
jgi:DNA-binding SARP family transcriptional activator